MKKKTKLDVLSLSLLILLVFLFFAIIIVTLWGVASGRVALGRTSLPSVSLDSTQAMFSDVRLIRAPTADSAVVILKIEFSYPRNDLAFQEELVYKARSLSLLVTNWIANQTREDLLTMGDVAVKEALKNELNKDLVLGNIKELYFTEYLILE